MHLPPRRAPLVVLLMLLIVAADSRADDAPANSSSSSPTVGATIDDGVIVATEQLIRPAGQQTEFHGRPIDLVLARGGKRVFVKDSARVLAIDVDTWQIKQGLAMPEKNRASLHGIAVSPDGSRLYVTAAGSALCEATINAVDGALAWSRTISLKASEKLKTRGGGDDSYPCGVAISPDGARAYVCLSTANSIAVVDLAAGAIVADIDVGVAPYAVALSADGKTAAVTNWGGRHPRAGEHAAPSAGTDVLIDDHGASASGTVSIVDLEGRRALKELAVGLHPSDVGLSADGRRAFVVNANADTVSVIDVSSPRDARVVETILVRPDPTLPFGSVSNALAVSADGKRLFVANGGNNALAVVTLADDPAPGAKSTVDGFIPTGWYPGAVACSADGKRLFVANVKGVGSRDPDNAGKWNSHHFWGTLSRIDVPDASQLGAYTQQVMRDALVPQTLRAWEKAQSGVKPAPVPAHVGEPSVFEHVVYVIKENRTYDQLLGDIGKGNCDPKLCTFGRRVTPNHHALAEQFVLLDNFYCNGVLSADGHAWATEGTTVNYLEKSFGAWVRSYPFGGDDPLAIAPTGFIWDDALLRGLSFRNYGEMIYCDPKPRGTWKQIYDDHVNKTGKYELINHVGPDTLSRYSHPKYPGWDTTISDAIRADYFLEEMKQFSQKKQWPNLITVYLPDDHTSGTSPRVPTPEAMVASNDLAVGRIVDAISHSPFWATTCIFVIEDDPQNGFDHVDGHRSMCLVVSPYTRRGQVVSEFYNQTSVLHTMELMLGLPPMNQMDAMAPVMTACFTDTADVKPYTHLKNNIPLDQMNPGKQALRGQALELAELSERQNFSKPDAIDDDALNRVIWHATRGDDAPYPAEFAGAHGKGLKPLRLKLEAGGRDKDHDD